MLAPCQITLASPLDLSFAAFSRQKATSSHQLSIFSEERKISRSPH
ncbi:MAG: hypothetical protein SAL07_22990 [Oscillatoria sp. PMC 1051.18]|nr:hypothetical protein [Oscillatoria sp. PMC 1050.18]MEC5032778.1 hypothetical protein [Oscillatoria sp. PMC 1051.18]